MSIISPDFGGKIVGFFLPKLRRSSSPITASSIKSRECPGVEAVIRQPGQTLLTIASEFARIFGKGIGFESRSVTVADWSELKVLAPAGGVGSNVRSGRGTSNHQG